MTVCASLLGLLLYHPCTIIPLYIAFTESLKIVPRKTIRFLWLVPIIPIVKEWQLFLKFFSFDLWAICLLPWGLDVDSLLCLAEAWGQFYALSKGACSKSLMEKLPLL